MKMPLIQNLGEGDRRTQVQYQTDVQSKPQAKKDPGVQVKWECGL